MPNIATKIMFDLQFAAQEEDRSKKGIAKLLSNGKKGLRTLQQMKDFVDAKDAPEVDSSSSSDDESDDSDAVRTKTIGGLSCFTSPGKTRLTDAADRDSGLASSVLHWKGKLQIGLVMSGKAMGREQNFANDCAERLRAKGHAADAAALTAHLKKVEAALKLTPKAIDRAPNIASLSEATNVLIDGDEDISTDSKRALVALWMDELQKAAKSGGANLKLLVEQSCPLVLVDAAQDSQETLGQEDAQTIKGVQQTFDPREPYLSAIEGDVASKIEIFAATFVKKFMVGIAQDSEQGYQRMVEVSEAVIAHYEKEVYADELSDEDRAHSPWRAKP